MNYLYSILVRFNTYTAASSPPMLTPNIFVTLNKLPALCNAYKI